MNRLVLSCENQRNEILRGVYPEQHEILRGACPEHSEILPLNCAQGQNDRRRRTQNVRKRRALNDNPILLS